MRHACQSSRTGAGKTPRTIDECRDCCRNQRACRAPADRHRRRGVFGPCVRRNDRPNKTTREPPGHPPSSTHQYRLRYARCWQAPRSSRPPLPSPSVRRRRRRTPPRGRWRRRLAQHAAGLQLSAMPDRASSAPEIVPCLARSLASRKSTSRMSGRPRLLIASRADSASPCLARSS